MKRGGLVTFASTSGVYTSLFAAEALATPVVIGATGTKLYKISTAGTETALTGTFSTGKRWDFVQSPVISSQGPVYGMNGTDTPQQFNGTSLGNWTATDAGGTVPNGTMCVYSNNQVFVAGTSANPSRVTYSAIGDPTGWNPANNLGAGFLDFDPDDGQVITALGTVGPYVLVAKPRKLFVIIQPGNAAVAASIRRLSQNIGCVAHRSLAQDPNGTYFLAEDRNVYVTNGTKITPLGDLIQPTFDSLTGPRSQAVGAAIDGHYYLSVPLNSSTNDTVLDFDTVLDSWWKHSFGSNAFTIFHQSGEPQLYSAKSTSAIVDNCFVPTAFQDNGSNFQWFWYGPWQSPSYYRRRLFPTPFYRKNLRQTRFDGNGVVDFALSKDFAAGAGVTLHTDIFNQANTGSDTFGGGGTFGAFDGTLFGSQSAQRARFFSLGYANAFSIQLSGTTDGPAAIYSYVLIMTDRRDMVVA